MHRYPYRYRLIGTKIEISVSVEFCEMTWNIGVGIGKISVNSISVIGISVNFHIGASLTNFVLQNLTSCTTVYMLEYFKIYLLNMQAYLCSLFFSALNSLILSPINPATNWITKYHLGILMCSDKNDSTFFISSTIRVVLQETLE